MDNMESFAKKVQQAARELIELKKERQHMISELEMLRRGSRDHHGLVRENERLKREQDQMRTRLIRLQKKIDKHLLVETALAAGAPGEN